MSQIYLLISVITLLAIITLFIFTMKRGKKRLTPLAGIAFAFVLAGTIFGDNRIIGYSLIGIGVILAIIDIIKNRKK